MTTRPLACGTALRAGALTLTLAFACGLGCSPSDAADAGGVGGAFAGSDGAASGGAASGGTWGAGGATSSGGAGTGGSWATGGATASGGAASGGAGTGGGVSYEPCPATGSCKILPLGDSITFGLTYDGGYRVQLFHLAHRDNHDITFVGSQPPNGPNMVDGVTFPKKHEGVSGETINQIAARVPTPGLTEMPHIILLHAGTNDMSSMASGSATRLGALLDKLIADAPEALIVVSSIIPLFGLPAVDTFNAAVPGLVQTRAAAGAHIVFVDQFTGFPTNELSDMIHPNQAGYERMAGKWYEAIESYLR